MRMLFLGCVLALGLACGGGGGGGIWYSERGTVYDKEYRPSYTTTVMVSNGYRTFPALKYHEAVWILHIKRDGDRFVKEVSESTYNSTDVGDRIYL